MTTDVLEDHSVDIHLSSASTLTSSSLFNTPPGSCQVTPHIEQQVDQNNSIIFPDPEEPSTFPIGNGELSNPTSVNAVESDAPAENGDISNLPNLLVITPDLSNNNKEKEEKQEEKPESEPDVKDNEALPASGTYRPSPMLRTYNWFLRTVLREELFHPWF